MLSKKELPIPRAKGRDEYCSNHGSEFQRHAEEGMSAKEEDRRDAQRNRVESGNQGTATEPPVYFKGAHSQAYQLRP